MSGFTPALFAAASIGARNSATRVAVSAAPPGERL